MWFDPGVGHVLPGEVLEYHRAANVLSVQAVIAGKVYLKFHLFLYMCFCLKYFSGVYFLYEKFYNRLGASLYMRELAGCLW